MRADLGLDEYFRPATSTTSHKGSTQPRMELNWSWGRAGYFPPSAHHPYHHLASNLIAACLYRWPRSVVASTYLVLMALVYFVQETRLFQAGGALKSGVRDVTAALPILRSTAPDSRRSWCSIAIVFFRSSLTRLLRSSQESEMAVPIRLTLKGRVVLSKHNKSSSLRLYSPSSIALPSQNPF